MKKILKKDQGFTLVEILIVIGIIAVLAAIVIVAVNPARLFGKARNTERWTEVNGIASAVIQNYADNAGVLPGPTSGVAAIPDVGGTAKQICTLATQALCEAANGGLGYVWLGSETTPAYLIPNFLPNIPVDPQGEPAAGASGYTIITATNNRVTISSSRAELGAVITITQ